MDGDFVTTDIRLIDRYKNGISHHKNTFDWQLLRGGFVTTKLCFIDRYFSRGGSHYRNTLDWQIWKGILHHRNTLDWQVWVADALPQKYAWLTGMNEGCTSPQKYGWLTGMNGKGLRHHKIMLYWQVLRGGGYATTEIRWIERLEERDTSLQKYVLLTRLIKKGISHYRNTFDWQIWKGEYVITGICFIDRYDKGILHHNL